jgi:hypothetical protein
MIGHPKQLSPALIILLVAAAVIALIIIAVSLNSKQTPKIQSQGIPAGAGKEYKQIISAASLQCGDHITLLSVTARPNGTVIYLFTPGKCSSWFATNVLSITYGNPLGEVRPAVYSVYKSALSAPISLGQWKISSTQAVNDAQSQCPATGGPVLQSELSTDIPGNELNWKVVFNTGSGIQTNVVRVNAFDGAVTCSP